MKKYLGRAILIIFLLAAVPAANASAAEGEGLKVDGSGRVTLTSSYAAQEGISSICFSLSVNSENAENVQFRFDESAAKIQEFRYDKENKKLNVYIAGTEALIKDGQSALSIGSIEVLDGNGSGTAAEVSVTAGSLMYVYGTELKWMADLEVSGAVNINTPANVPPVSDPDPSEGEDPAPTTAPQSTPQPTRAPQAASTPWPVTSSQTNTAMPTATPQPTATPTPTPAATPTPSESPAPEGSSEEPESTEVMLPQENGEGNSSNESEEGAGGIDWVFVIAIAAIVLFAVVVVMAVVVLKKKPPKSGGLDEGI